MNDHDTLQRFIFENAFVRGEIVHLNETYQTIITQHAYPPRIRQLLGEMLVIAALLNAIIKVKGRLTVQFQSKTELKLLMAQCTNQNQLRAIAQYNGDLTDAELDNALQQGLLAIIMEPETTGKRYQGVVSWQGHSLRESIEGYFKNSEQLPTRLWLSVNDTKAVGLLLQTLPRESDRPGKKRHLLPDDHWEHLVHLTNTLSSKELLTLDNNTLFKRLYHEEDVRVFTPEPLSFGCTCSVARSENAILLLGREEVEDELKDKQAIAVTCDFCHKQYLFDRVDIEKIFKKGESSSKHH